MDTRATLALSCVAHRILNESSKIPGGLPVSKHFDSSHKGDGMSIGKVGILGF